MEDLKKSSIFLGYKVRGKLLLIRRRLDKLLPTLEKLLKTPEQGAATQVS